MQINKDTRTEPIVKEVILNASAEKVWKVITDPNELKHWYLEVKDLKPEPGFEFKLYGNKEGRKYAISCQVVEVIENKKLSYTWNYDDFPGETLVTFELFSVDESTRLRLTHIGLENIPVQYTDVSRENHVEGWNYIIGTLIKEYVEKNPS